MADKSYTPASGDPFQVRQLPGGRLSVEGAGGKTDTRIECESARIDHQAQRLVWEKEGSRKLFWVYESRGKRVLSWPGGSMELEAADLSEGAGASGGKLKPLKLTMPGKVVAVQVKEGDLVEAGQGLVIVEAMKMENLLLSPARARVGKLHVQPGDRLESGAVLVTFEAAP